MNAISQCGEGIGCIRAVIEIMIVSEREGASKDRSEVLWNTCYGEMK